MYKAALTAGFAALLGELGPGAAAAGVLRRHLPAWSGTGAADRVALTVDDGPDPESTPYLLKELDRVQARGTFFVLGERLAAHPDLGRRIVDSGNELAVHGWSHRPHVLRTPRAVAADLRLGRDCIRHTCRAEPRFWRPPHGIPTATGIRTARRLGLRLVLWSADGRDWRADISSAAVAGRVARQLRAGGVVLLHDMPVGAGPQAWRASAGAVQEIVEDCRRRGWSVGPLREHGMTHIDEGGRHGSG